MFEATIKREVMKAKEALKEELRVDTRTTIKAICKEMVIELFSEPRDTEKEYFYLSSFEVDTVVGTLRKGVKKSVNEHVGIMCQTEVELLIKGEAFIDSIVDRIRKKQLKVN